MNAKLVPLALMLAVALAGCTAQQAPMTVTPQVGDPQPQSVDASALNAEAHASTPARALPYKGRLVAGDPSELPPAVAASLSKDGPLTFSYREELTHDEYHIPYIFSSFDPVTYLGAPLGDYAVTATATLTISQGDRTIADYTAKARVSKSYNIYSEPKHSEVERAARDEVRRRIDQKLYDDAAHIGSGNPAAPSPSLPE